jgi:hypothetical protein
VGNMLQANLKVQLKPASFADDDVQSGSEVGKLQVSEKQIC